MPINSSLLIRHATIMLPDGECIVGDVLVRDRLIAQFAPEISVSGIQEIDATGLTLLPGVIDPQVHFR